MNPTREVHNDTPHQVRRRNPRPVFEHLVNLPGGWTEICAHLVSLPTMWVVTRGSPRTHAPVDGPALWARAVPGADRVAGRVVG